MVATALHTDLVRNLGAAGSAITASVLLLGIAPVPAAAADDADCVTYAEFEYDPLGTHTFRHIREIFGSPIAKRPNPEPTSDLSMSATRYVTFDYATCDGASLYVVYERPSKRHPKTREWVLMRWTPAPAA